MKKHVIALTVMIGIALVTGCGKREAVQPKEVVLSNSMEEVSAHFEEILETWEETQTLLKIDDLLLECTIDDLRMKEGANEKDASNVTLDISVYYDPTQITGNEQDMVNQLCDELAAAVRSPRVHTLNIACYSSLNDIGRYGINTLGVSITDSSIKVHQSEEERNAQTIAYDFVKNWNDTEFKNDTGYPYDIATLSHFGIKKDTEELYVEMRIYSSNIEDIEAFRNSMESKSDELCLLLTSDKDVMTYLEKNSLKQITVTICTDWNMGDKYYSYSYELGDSD